MAETLTLSSPVGAQVGATEFRVWSLYLKRDGGIDDPAEIRVIFKEHDGAGAFLPNGRTITCRYDEAEAETLIAALNKANLSTKSLERRVTERCQADKKLGAGSISGTA